MQECRQADYHCIRLGDGIRGIRRDHARGEHPVAKDASVMDPAGALVRLKCPGRATPKRYGMPRKRKLYSCSGASSTRSHYGNAHFLPLPTRRPERVRTLQIERRSLAMSWYFDHIV